MLWNGEFKELRDNHGTLAFCDYCLNRTMKFVISQLEMEENYVQQS